jgi:hypothetical protein
MTSSNVLTFLAKQTLLTFFTTNLYIMVFSDLFVDKLIWSYISYY